MTHTPLPIETITVDQVAYILKCSPKTVMEKASRGLIPGAKVGKAWFFKTSDIQQYVNNEITEQTQKRKKRYEPHDNMPRSYASPTIKSRSYPDLSAYRKYLQP